MKNILKTVNENNQEITIEILLNYKIEEYNKEYVVYTINDDESENDALVFISELYYENNVPKIKSIDENEKEMVLLFYNNIKNEILKNS